jgi:hypothetical protein
MIFNERRQGCLYNLHHLKASLRTTWQLGDVSPTQTKEDDGWGPVIEFEDLMSVQVEKISAALLERQVSPTEFAFIETPHRIRRVYAGLKSA